MAENKISLEELEDLRLQDLSHNCDSRWWVDINKLSQADQERVTKARKDYLDRKHEEEQELIARAKERKQFFNSISLDR